MKKTVLATALALASMTLTFAAQTPAKPVAQGQTDTSKPKKGKDTSKKAPKKDTSKPAAAKPAASTATPAATTAPVKK